MPPERHLLTRRNYTLELCPPAMPAPVVPLADFAASRTETASRMTKKMKLQEETPIVIPVPVPVPVPVTNTAAVIVNTGEDDDYDME